MYARRVDSLLALASLFVASFLAATLIPLSSEAALFAVLKLDPSLFWPAIGVATLGNTAGGVTTWLIGRSITKMRGDPAPMRQLERVRRWGAPVLLLAWLPLVGDGLVLAAGWLKIGWLPAALWQAAGRFARYW